MSELIIRNLQRTRPVNLRFLRALADGFLRRRLGERPYEIGLFLVGPQRMARLNQEHLQHSGSTDVITFAYTGPEESGPLIGDIFVCPVEASRQAVEFKTTWQSELVRYFVHGVLHLQGYDDLQPRLRQEMKREENRLVRELSLDHSLTDLGETPAARRWRRTRA